MSDRNLHPVMQAALETFMPTADPRDPHPTRTGIFRDHNCWKCRNGELPCVSRDSVCEYPHARND